MSSSWVSDANTPVPLTTEIIQRYLEENQQLILAILESQNLGKFDDCVLYQARLHQNLMYLASLAETQPNNQGASKYNLRNNTTVNKTNNVDNNNTSTQ